MQRAMTPEEQQAAMDKAHAKGLAVEYRSVPEIGIVSAREVPREEMEEGRRQFSEKFYPDFRLKGLRWKNGQK